MVMPSPLPGMDPWLEAPSIWPDFHDRLAEELSAILNLSLPEPYYAQLGVREELGIVGGIVSRRIIPDVSVQKPPASGGLNRRGDGTAVLDGPRAALTESYEISALDEPREVSFVEVRDSRLGHEVVTLIEILSPTNKHPGPDRDNYMRKRNEILASQSSLIEIDLLRMGDRDFYGQEVFKRLLGFDPPLDYVILVQRAWKRGRPLQYQLFPSRLTDSLPVVAVPLRESDAESSLDIQYAFQQTYDRGPYRRGAVDYDQPPDPSLPEPMLCWARTQIANWRSRNRDIV